MNAGVKSQHASSVRVYRKHTARVEVVESLCVVHIYVKLLSSGFYFIFFFRALQPR